MSRTSLKEFKKKALSKEAVKKEYQSLSAAYTLRKKLIKLRHEAGLTQEQIADALHTNKSNISRLENANSAISPKISTIEQYADAIGYDIEIRFIPKKAHNKRIQRTK